MKTKRYLKNVELYKPLTFELYKEYITTKIVDGRAVRCIEDFRKENKTMCIIDAMMDFAKSLNQPWQADFYKAACSNCIVYIDGYVNDDNIICVGASIAFPKGNENSAFEFLIATIGPDDEDTTPLQNIHYKKEGEVLRLSPDFRIKP